MDHRAELPGVEELFRATIPQRPAGSGSGERYAQDELRQTLGAFYAELETAVSDAARRAAREAVAAEVGELRDGSARLILSDVQRSSWVGLVTVTVTLLHRDVEHVGTASGPRTPHDLRLAATATLEAAERATDNRGVLSVRKVALLDLWDRRVLTVVVGSRTGPGDDTIGAVIAADGDIRTAAARATLDAVDRRLRRPQR